MAMLLITPAMVAATLEMRMSLFLICPTSWASTPLSSFGVSNCMMPVVTATAACFGFLPVANAFA